MGRIAEGHVPEGETPAGFEIKYNMVEGQVLEIDLIRNISYDKNGCKRPTKFIFSADTANPNELRPIKNLIGNLTCNPGIIYDLFINNPKTNVGHKYKTRNEVMFLWKSKKEKFTRFLEKTARESQH